MPVEIQRLLGVKPRDEVAWDVVDGVVVVKRPRFTIEQLAARTIKPMKPIHDIDEAIREAKSDKADETLRKMRED